MDRFASEFQDVLAHMFTAAEERLDNPVDVEHLLLAILEDQSGIVTLSLIMLRIDVEELKGHLVSDLNKPGRRYHSAHPLAPIGFTESLNNVIRNSAIESANIHDRQIGSIHILLAILRFPDLAATSLFAQYGVDYESLLETVKDLRNSDITH